MPVLGNKHYPTLTKHKNYKTMLCSYAKYCFKILLCNFLNHTGMLFIFIIINSYKQNFTTIFFYFFGILFIFYLVNSRICRLVIFKLLKQANQHFFLGYKLYQQNPFQSAIHGVLYIYFLLNSKQ